MPRATVQLESDLLGIILECYLLRAEYQQAKREYSALNMPFFEDGLALTPDDLTRLDEARALHSQILMRLGSHSAWAKR